MDQRIGGQPRLRDHQHRPRRASKALARCRSGTHRPEFREIPDELSANELLSAAAAAVRTGDLMLA
jgi:hypothetical protein